MHLYGSRLCALHFYALPLHGTIFPRFSTPRNLARFSRPRNSSPTIFARVSTSRNSSPTLFAWFSTAVESHDVCDGFDIPEFESHDICEVFDEKRQKHPRVFTRAEVRYHAICGVFKRPDVRYRAICGVFQAPRCPLPCYSPRVRGVLHLYYKNRFSSRGSSACPRRTTSVLQKSPFQPRKLCVSAAYYVCTTKVDFPATPAPGVPGVLDLY